MTDETEAMPAPTAIDEELIKSYRSIADEEVPSHLDQIVLKIASLDARNNSFFNWFLPWMRPATFVATAGLSLAVLIELSEISFFEWDSSLPSAGESQAEDNSNNVSTTTEPARLRAAGTAELANSGTLQKFESEATESSSRMQEIGQTAKHRSLGSERSIGFSPSQVSNACKDADTKSIDAWLECIAKLKADGLAGEADIEIKRLLLAHPDFSLESVR